MQQLFNLIEHTHRSIFLTGKAGTGKTTFLGDFIKRTQKKYVVVAPTGIAAINAGGVTIHSMFGLPLKTHIPSFDDVDPNEANNIQHLLPHFKYRREKLKLLRNLDILIVDEVSMLRCDVMDMMDLALRSARRSSQKFGGVQLLLIGDLYQLPPVVKEESERILYKYYASPFFFDAAAIKETNLLTVELKKVYRQTDEKFLQLLNAIRDKDFDAIDFELLNSRYDPSFEPKESYVYLTSHNYMADNINRSSLEKIKEKPVVYKAKIDGDFKPHLYPNEEELVLKIGAQVMFIRNDTSETKRYFNGKLAKVTALKDDSITVLPQDETRELDIERELWEHKKYRLNQQKNVEEDVIGSYGQFPFRLAWAVTIHKSQGLTFDRVIIDAGRSFTAGQVYVALSRCRTLEGIVLKSSITPGIILTDDRIAFFQNETDAGEKIEAILEDEKYNYAVAKLLLRLDVKWLKDEMEAWRDAVAESKFLKSEKATELAEKLIPHSGQLVEVFEKFVVFIRAKTRQAASDAPAWQIVEDKSVGAVHYFFENINTKYFEPLKSMYATTKGKVGLKGYNDVLKTLLEDLEEYLNGLKQVTLLDKPLYVKKEEDVISMKVEKKPSHLISFEMFEQGRAVVEIANERGVTAGTVLGHLSKMATVLVLDIERLFPKKIIDNFERVYSENSFESVTQWKAALPDELDFNEVRILLDHFNYQKKKKKQGE